MRGVFGVGLVRGVYFGGRIGKMGGCLLLKLTKALGT